MILHAAGSALFADGFVAEIHTNQGVEFLTDFDKSVFYHGSIRGEWNLPRRALSLHADLPLQKPQCLYHTESVIVVE